MKTMSCALRARRARVVAVSCRASEVEAEYPSFEVEEEKEDLPSSRNQYLEDLAGVWWNAKTAGLLKARQSQKKRTKKLHRQQQEYES